MIYKVCLNIHLGKTISVIFRMIYVACKAPCLLYSTCCSLELHYAAMFPTHIPSDLALCRDFPIPMLGSVHSIFLGGIFILQKMLHPFVLV